jgi:hypothetical protein
MGRKVLGSKKKDIPVNKKIERAKKKKRNK